MTTPPLWTVRRDLEAKGFTIHTRSSSVLFVPGKKEDLIPILQPILESRGLPLDKVQIEPGITGVFVRVPRARMP